MRASISSLLIAIALLGGCRNEAPGRGGQPRASETSTAGREGGQLVVRLDSDIKTLNYVLHTLDAERQVLSYLYDPLIDIDQNLEPIPGTAARWEVQNGGRVYVLHLDPRATFSDGTSVRAADVIFTMHRILDEDALQFAAWLDHLDREETKALDDRTVRLVFKEARVGQLYQLNFGIMPEHVYAKEKFGVTQKVIGNGPYVLKRRGRDRSVLLERREDYWRTKPAIESVLFRPIADDAVAWKAVQRDDIHVSRVTNDIWARVRKDPSVQRKIRFFDVYQFSYNAIAWNLSDPILRDARVRRALALSFDRNSVIESLYHRQARPVTGPFTPDHWAANPAVEPIGFNPEAAAALLSSAGWADPDRDGVLDRDGRPLALTLLVPAGNKPAADQSQVFQAALRRIGVNLSVTPIDSTAFFERVMNRNYQAAFLNWVHDPDPDPYSLFHSSQMPPDGLNVVGYANAEADALMERARAEFNRARRTELFHDLHEILAADQPYLWTVQTGAKWAVNHRVENVQVAKGVGLFGWHPGPLAWWLRK